MRALRRLSRALFNGRKPYPGRLAFKALAADSGLLTRLPRNQARRLCAQAELYAVWVLKDFSRGGDPTSRDEAASVLKVISAFNTRDDFHEQSVEDMVASALTHAPDGLGGLIAALSRPDPTLCTWRELALDAVQALGAEGLQRLDRESAETLMLAASRAAARCLRGQAGPTSPPDASAVGGDHPINRALAIVEAVYRRWRVLPLTPAPTGNREEWAAHLVDLWRDCATCAERPGAGDQRRIWEDARDGHAFGAVWLVPSILQELGRPDAERLAQDARAAATFVLRFRTPRPGLGPAIEAARSVVVTCDAELAPNLVHIRQRRGGEAAGEPLRREEPPARASHA